MIDGSLSDRIARGDCPPWRVPACDRQLHDHALLADQNAVNMEDTMRELHIGIIGLFAVAIAIFAFQNLQLVTVSFLGLSLRAPLALVAIVVYLLGMVTGSSLLSVLRRSVEEARRHPR